MSAIFTRKKFRVKARHISLPNGVYLSRNFELRGKDVIRSRFLSFVSCVFLLAGKGTQPVLAQQAASADKLPSENQIVQWIESDSPREMAWGAHYASLAATSRLKENLLAAAARWQPLEDLSSSPRNRWEVTPEQIDQQDAMAAVLDALIQLHVDTPAETLRGLAADFPSETAILLSRLPQDEASDLAMEFFRKPPQGADSLQYVSASLLAVSPPPKYAAALLAGTNTEAIVYIVLPGEGAGHGSSMDCMGEPVPKKRGDWPLIALYHLSKYQGDRATPLFSVPDPLYLKRIESVHYGHHFCGDLTLTNEDRRRFLAYLLKMEVSQIGWQTERTENIVYQSQQQLNFDLRHLIEEEQGKYRITAQQLAEKGLMRDDAIEQSLPVFHLHCVNYAGKQLTEIPQPSPLPERVRWELNPF